MSDRSAARLAPAGVTPKLAGFAVAGSLKRYTTIDNLLAAAEPPVSPAQRRRFDARKERARGMLARLKTPAELQAMHAMATDAHIAAVEKLIETVKQEATYPTPTEFRVRDDGCLELRW